MFLQFGQCILFWFFEAIRLYLYHFVVDLLFAVCIEAKVMNVPQENYPGKLAQQSCSERLIIVIKTFVKLVSDDVGYGS